MAYLAALGARMGAAVVVAVARDGVSVSVLKLDFDGGVPRDFTKRLGWIADTVPFEIRGVRWLRSQSGGAHVVVRTSRLSLRDRVMAQALLGSDYKRETFNWIRVSALDRTPRFWRARLNVLYSSKLGERRMAKVRVADYSQSRPVLTPDDFPRSATVIAFTIAKVERTQFENAEGEGKQNRIVLSSEEHGDKVFWLNVTGIKTLVKRLGDDDEGWVGVTIPLVRARTNNPSTGKQVEVLWVAAFDDDDSWDAVAPKKVRGGAKKRR